MLNSLRSMIVILTFLVGCSPPPATPKTFADFNVQANHEQRISLEGYVRFPVSTIVRDTMMLDLHESPEPDSRFVPVSFTIGTGANQVEKPPERYTDRDLKLHASDGTLVGPGELVRVSGKLIYSKSASILSRPIVVEKL